METESNYYKEIINKLERLTKREYSLFAAIGIQAAVIITILTYLTFTLVETFGHFSSTIRTVLFFVFIILTAASFLFLFVVPLLKYFNIFRKTDYHKVAGKVGKQFPGIKDDLLNAMQLVSEERKQEGYSPGLIDAAFKNVYNRTKSINFDTIVNFQKAKQLLAYLSGTLVVFAVLFFLIPGIQAASGRILNYNKDFITPPKFTFKIEPGNATVTKGDDISISVKIAGQKPGKVYLAVKSSDQTNFENEELKPDSTGIYKFVSHAVRNSFKYYATAQNIDSKQYLIDVINPPIIKNLDLTVTPPTYSKLPEINQKDNGNVTALVGSNVHLKITSTKNLTDAKLQFSDTTGRRMKVNASEASINFRVKKDNSYKIILTDERGDQNSSPITYSIKALFDAYPSIEMILPDKDVSLPNDNRLPLEVKVTDDYGFTKLVLHYRLSASKYEPTQKEFKSIEIPLPKGQTEADINYIWNLTQMNLATEDVVSYYLKIFDNDIISGPKSTKTSMFKVRVPTLNEILSKADNTQNNSISDLNDTYKEAEDLRQTMENISRELKQNKKDITWEEKQKIEQAVDKFDKLQNKVKDIKKQLEKMQQDLQQNKLLSKETMEKYMELQKLFHEMTNEDMKKAMEKLRDTLKSMLRQQTQQAMENVKFNEEQFKKSIERTMNLLKRIQVEQKVDELVKRAEQLKKSQQEVKKQTENNKSSNNSDKNDLTNKQNEISKNLNKFSEELKNLTEKMSELKDMPKDQAQKLSDEYKKQENQKLSRQASQNIQQNQNQQAMQNQSEVAQNMSQMQKGMENLQKSINQQNQVQTFKDMMKITDNLVTLSKQQEGLKNQSKNMDPNSSSFNENAQQQNDIQRNLQKIMQSMSSVSQKTFAITPEMGKSLGDAQRDMMKAIEQMQNRNGRQASQNQGQAMESLNQAAERMKNSMQAMMQGGGQGGMMSLMQQLGKMSSQQMNLNNLTQMLRNAQQGKLTMEQQAQLQRLAQQQDLIGKSLEQLNKEAKLSGQSKKIPADLEHIAKQMQEVVTNLKSDDLNEKTTQLQEHILSKLLDAQRSVNERDYEKERQSKAGEDLVSNSPAELNLSSEKGKSRLKDELNKSVQQGYSKDYEDLIKKYFEALEKQNVKN